MVKLTLTPHRGNGARTFPATGHLGLSPVTLAGVVRVKVEEDRKTIDASEVLVRVRCYESVGGSSSSSTATSSSVSCGNGSSVGSSSNGTDTSASSYASTSVADLIKGGSGVPKGNVLYEQSITMWLPPSPQLGPVASTSTSTSYTRASTTASTSSYYSTSEFDSTGSASSRSSTSTSPSPSPTLTSPPCSRSNSADPHAYPPKPRRRDDDTSLSQPSVIYGTLGDLQKAFRIVIPPDAVGKGAKSTMIYKTWRIWWAIEAVIAHRPSGIHGDRIVKSHQVALISYASHRSPGPLEWISPSVAYTSSSDTSRLTGETSASPIQSSQQQPSLSYSITAPAAAFAASDPVAVAVTLTKRYPTAEAPRKIVLELMREITYAQPDPVSSGASTHAESSSASTSTTSAVSPSSSATTITSGRLSSYFSSNRQSRANSNGASHAAPAGLSLSLASSHTFSTSRRRSEAQEPLISPPLLTSASTASSSSVALPATPPTFVPTPSEQSHTTGDSYFGLFAGSSTASLEPMETLSAASLASAPFSMMSSKKSITGSSSLAPAATLTIAAAGSAARRRREYVTLATFETDCAFSASSNGTTWSGQITGTMPKAKSIYHYALGETCTTQSASSRFYLVPKIYFKSKTHVLELPPRLVAFQTMSMEERRKAKEMLPKTLAVQKAEAKLFGGVEIVAPAASTFESRSKSASRSTASSTHPSPSAKTHSRPGLSPAPSTSSMSASARSAPGNIPTQSGTNSSLASTHESSSRSPGALRSARIVTSRPSAGNSSEDEMLDLQHFGYLKTSEGTSMRRRSEQSASSESLRMRQRFGAAPDLSPVIGSPYIEAVSPSLSVISSSTQRPRSANKRPTTGNSSLRSGTTAFSSSSTARPVSSGGLEPSNASIRSVSSGRFGHITTFADLSNSSLLEPLPRSDTQTAPPVLVRLESAKRDDARDSSMSEDDDVHHRLQPSVVNGLFADFSGFTLKPPERIDGKIRPVTKTEDRIPPKSTTPMKSSSSSSSSKRKNAEGHFASTGQSPSKTSAAAGPVSAPKLVHMQVSPPPLNRLPSETAPLSSATMAKSVSQALSLPSPKASPEIPRARRVKSGGVASAFAFFRRGSAKT